MTINNIAHVHECIVYLHEELGFSELINDQPPSSPEEESVDKIFETVLGGGSDPPSAQGEKLPQWALSADSRRNTDDSMDGKLEEPAAISKLTCSNETSNEHLQSLVEMATSDMKATIFKLLEILPKKVFSFFAQCCKLYLYFNRIRIIQLYKIDLLKLNQQCEFV